MIKKAAGSWANWLSVNGVVDHRKDKIYAYGLELLLSGAVNVLSVLLISIVFFRSSSGLFFLLAFIPLRSTAGGYHANSHWSCNLVFLATFIGLHSLTYMFQKQYTVVFCLVVASISFVTLLLTAPCEAGNKPLTFERHKRNRRWSLLIGWVNLMAAAMVLLVATTHIYLWAINYYLGVLAASLSMWATQIMKRM